MDGWFVMMVGLLAGVVVGRVLVGRSGFGGRAGFRLGAVGWRRFRLERFLLGVVVVGRADGW